MAKHHKKQSYFESRPDIVTLFEDLEEYYEFCRSELRDYNPADLYRRDSRNYRAFVASKHGNVRRPTYNNRTRNRANSN